MNARRLGSFTSFWSFVIRVSLAIRHWSFVIPMVALVTTSAAFGADVPANNIGGTLVTNGSAVFRLNGGEPSTGKPATKVFDHFLAESLGNHVWTNLLAHTNGRETRICWERTHPPGWPAKPPILKWNTNGLMWGMKGLTGFSPCWSDEGGNGQASVTALTKRHGYVRGHDMGPDGFGRNRKGKKVWFLTTNNVLVEEVVSREVVRIYRESQRDYTILVFTKDLPDTIQPLRVVAPTELIKKWPTDGVVPFPLFATEQAGSVSANIPGLTVNTWKPGDSGAPNLLPLPGELVFVSGRSTSGASPEMQADIDELCRLERLDPKKYQLQWLDLWTFPSYP